MQSLTRPFGVPPVQVDGPEDAPSVIFANALGTDPRRWDRVLPLLSRGLRHIRHDKRGPVVFVGLSTGGLIGQVVASQWPDLQRALVLSAFGHSEIDQLIARLDLIVAVPLNCPSWEVDIVLHGRRLMQSENRLGGVSVFRKSGNRFSGSNWRKMEN